MSRRERDARDSHGKRLHSRFDREPSPKKLKRDEKPEANLTHSSHRRSSLAEATGPEQKQRPGQDGVTLKTPLASSAPGITNEKKNAEVKGNKPPMDTQHSSDNRDAHGSRSYFQHDDRGSVGQGGRTFGRSRANDHHRRWDDSREPYNISRARDEADDGPPKKDERSQSHAAGERSGAWKHDRFHELESGAPPPARKRPAFREKKMPPLEPGTGAALLASDKSKPPDLAAAKREERGGFNARDRRERRGDGFCHNLRGEAQRNDADQWRERYYGGTRGRGERLHIQYGGERGAIRPGGGGLEAEKWKHDLFDEASRSPPPKNEEEQIARVEALLAL